MSLLWRTWRAGERAETLGTGREWERRKRVLRKRRNLGVYQPERKLGFAIHKAEQRQSLGGWC